MTTEIERRFVAQELRATGDGETARTLAGYAAVFNVASEDLGGFREVIAPGAFAASLSAGADVRALFNHDANMVLGRSGAQTLRLWEDGTGLGFELDLPATNAGWDVWRLVQRGDVSQMSFGFVTRADEWDLKGETPLRTLRAVDLYDVSPVTWPAYPQTSVDVRAMVERFGREQVVRPGRLALRRRRMELAERA